MSNITIHSESNFKKWQPIESLEGLFFLESLCFTYENLTIILKNDLNVKLKIVFDSYYGLRSFDESYRRMLWETHNELFRYWSFFECNSSEFLNWFYTENYNIFENGTIHFLIGAGDEIIEVISNFYPQSSFIDL